MKLWLPLLSAFIIVSPALAQDVKRDIPYGSPAAERQVLDVYAPRGAKDLPVVFWIHGGGWQAGDKSEAQEKPRAFTERKFVFVPTNYRLLPKVDMATIIRDVAKSLGWVHREKFGNDPEKHRDFSAVTHVAKGKGIPPFLILHVADHPDVTAQAERLAAVLKDTRPDRKPTDRRASKPQAGSIKRPLRMRRSNIAATQSLEVEVAAMYPMGAKISCSVPSWAWDGHAALPAHASRGGG